jgi:hypothetical protein
MLTITAGACAPGVPPQPTALANISFSPVNAPPPPQTTLSNAGALSAYTTTITLTYTQTGAVLAPSQLLLLSQAAGPACASISTYAWPATLAQTVLELPAAAATAAAAASAPLAASAAATQPATPDDDASYARGDGRLGPYQSAGVGVSCTVVFLAVVYLLSLLCRRVRRRRLLARLADDENLRGKVELPGDCECAKHAPVAELPAVEPPRPPVELPAFEWAGGGGGPALSELSSGDEEGSERGKTGSPLGDWLPTPI